MKYAFSRENGRYIGVFLDDFEIPEIYGFINIEPIDLFKPVIDDVLNPVNWVEGLTAAEIDKINTAKLIEEQKIKREKIIKEKLDKMAEEQINLNPLSNPDFYPIWAAGTYAINVIVMYKSKLFKNTTANNSNAPDKGGWNEIK